MAAAGFAGIGTLPPLLLLVRASSAQII